MRDPDRHLRVVDLVGRDEAEHRPDVGEGRSRDVIVRAGTEGVVELVLVGVHEEVDGAGLGHAQQLRGRRDLVLPELERLGTECRVALVPVHPDQAAGRGLPVEPVVGVHDVDLGPERRRARVSRE